MKFKNVIYGVLLLSSVTMVACKPNIEEQNEFIRFVKLEKVSDCENVEKFIFNGKVKEKSLTSLSFRVGGPLVELNINTGDYVNKGDIIAKIDSRDYKIQVDTRKAQYLQVKAEYLRYKELYENKKIPANTYEKIESGYLMAKASYENAENQLKDTELKAPFSGYIHEKLVENFNTIGIGQPIVSIIDLSQLEIIVSVPENQVLDIRNCDENYLTVKNADVFEVPAKLLNINEKTGVDGLYEVRYILKQNSDLNILPGMTAEIKVVCKEKEKSLGISTDAVFFNNNSTCVWVYDQENQQIKKREVIVSSIKPDGKLKLIKGLNRGDLIITAGIHSLKDGQKVRPISPKSKTNIGGLL